MNLLETILNSGNGAVVKQLAGALGLDESDAAKAVQHLTPALSRGLKQQAGNPEGLKALMNALTSGNHSRYIDEPEQLNRENSIMDGNAILGHILGSKDVSRQVASRAAEKTGLDNGILKKMLPMLGAVVMGAMSKQTQGGGLLNSLTGGGNILTSFLDADDDGSIADDLLSMAGKLF